MQFNFNELKTQVHIENCKTLKDGLEFISKPDFKNQFDKNLNTKAIILNINSELKNVETLRQNDFSSKQKLVVVYQSNVIKEQKIITWRNRKNENFYKLEFNEKFSSELSNFVLEFIIKILAKNKSIEFPQINDETEIVLINLRDAEGHNLLMLAIEKENKELFDELLQYQFDHHDKSNQGETAADLAMKKENDEILLELFKNDSPIPKDFAIEESSEEIKKLFDSFIEMHKAIKENVEKNVKDLLKEHPKIKYFYNTENKSAAFLAGKLKRKEIYKLLIDNKCSIGPHEPYEEIIDVVKEVLQDSGQLTEADMMNYHVNNALNFSDKYLLFHWVNSAASHDENNPDNYMSFRREIFEIINASTDGKIILQVTATCKKVKTHFDFKRESVNFIYPLGSSKNTHGLHSRLLYQLFVGAKCTENFRQYDKFKKKIAGIVKHEHCHLALLLVFQNDCKPYGIDDEKNRKEFERIVEKSKKLKDVEDIINKVYDYHESLQHAELAVRPAQIITHYHDNNELLKKRHKEFKNLFEYYENFVIEKMQHSLPLLEKLSNESKEISFLELTEPLQSAIKHFNVNFQGNLIKLKDISDFNILMNLSSTYIRNILEGKQFIINDKLRKTKSFHMERKFIDIEMQKKVWNLNFFTNAYKLSDEAKNLSKDFHLILQEVKETKLFLLSDHAGAGKSMSMKFFAEKLKNELPNYWISYIDLKRHIKIYDKFKIKDIDLNVTSSEDEETNKEEHQENVKENIFKMIVKILSVTDFEFIIFKFLFNAGRVILLFDGVDEIAPKYEEFLLKLFESIRILTENQQWIATRPQHIENLKNTLSHNVSYTLLPFDTDGAIEFISQYLKSEKYSNEIIEIIRKLNLNRSPLILIIVADLYVAGKLPEKNINQFSLYEAMQYIKMKEILPDKGKIVNADSNNEAKVNVFEVHQIYSIKLLFFKEEFADLFGENFPKNFDIDELDFLKFSNFLLFKKWPRFKPKWSSEAISRSGFLIIENWNSENEFPNFSHQTFAEFFLAKFIIEHVQEAIEYGDDLTRKEFEIRMKFAAHMIWRYCNTQYHTFDVVCKFISDYCSLQNEKLVLFDEFLEFLEQDITKEIIRKMIEFSSINKFVSLVSRFIKFTKFEKRIFNALCLVDIHGRSLLFESVNSKSETTATVELFDIFKNSNFSNWYKLTGYGLNLNETEMPSEKELENVAQNSLIINLNYFQENENQKELPNLTFLYQFLCFIISVNDIEFEIVKNYLSNYSNEFSLLFLGNEKMMDKYFEIAKKYFNCNTEIIADIFNEFGQKSTQKLLQHEKLEISFLYRNNLIYFYEKVEEIFESDEKLIRRSLSEDKTKSSYILGFAVLLKIDLIKNFFKKCFNLIEIFSILIEAFIINLNHIDKPKALEIFNEYCKEISEYTNIFQVFLNHCNNLEYFFKLIIAFKKLWENYWLIHTGYEIRINIEEFDLIQVNGKLDEISVEMFPKSEQTPDENEEMRTKFLRTHELLCFIENISIHNEELENFLINNLGDILAFAFNCQTFFIDKILELLERIENYEKLLKIVQNGIDTLEIKNINSKLHFQWLSNIEYFSYKLKEFFCDDCMNLEKNLLEQCQKIFKPLFVCAINYNLENILQLFKKFSTSEEITKLILRDIYNHGKSRPENFSVFFKNHFKFYKTQNYQEKNQGIFVKASFIEFEDHLSSKQKKSEVIFQCLNFINQIEISQIDVEEFFDKNFAKILPYLFCCSSMVKMTFEIIEKYLKDKSFFIKLIVHSVDKKSLPISSSNLPLSRREKITNSCRQMMNLFWSNVIEFLEEKEELVREVLLYQYKFAHPLKTSILYDIEDLKYFYVEYCNAQEILNIIVTDKTQKNVNYSSLEKFVCQNFLSENSKFHRSELITFFDNFNGKSKLKLLINKIDSKRIPMVRHKRKIRRF